MTPDSFASSFESISKVSADFQSNESYYLSTKFQEAETRQLFIDKLWDALGWDIYHHNNPNPYEREVRIEKSVMIDGRGKRADYAFFTSPDFIQPRFMAEAKKPSKNLENPQDCFQSIRYGWNSNTPISVLTDFEQFLILDSRYKPDIATATGSILERFHYSEFNKEEKFRQIYHLFSREYVLQNSLEKYADSLTKSRGTRKSKLFNTSIIQPIDKEFLKELDEQRLSLARAFKEKNRDLNGETLTEITQRTLDRLVFLRFLEDKLVETDPVIDNLGRKTGSAWRDFISEMPRLNGIYNGTLFKPHKLLDNADFAPDEEAFAQTRDWLSHLNSPYDFNTIPIHILGSIYERFLGKIIEATKTSATVVDKPEVRKAGGVYYTPEYIVRYIIEKTIGKLIEGKTPEEIAKLRFADIACGSGSFLLGVFDYLISYHVEYHGSNKSRREKAKKQGLCRETSEGNLQLTIHYKREILLNNIFGVDLDAQAVEVAQFSLYLKLLEEETPFTKQQYLSGYREQLLPSLSKNIIHGNSLIDYDYTDEMLFDSDELKFINPLNFKQSFPEVFAGGGFDAIVGNPPYVRQELFSDKKPYFQKNYQTYHGVADLYVYFFERYTELLKSGGEFGIIVANKWFRANYSEPLRHWLKNFEIAEIVDFGDLPVFQGATTYPCIVRVLKNKSKKTFPVTELKSLDFSQKSLNDHINENQFSVNQSELEDKGWSLTDEASQKLLNKIRSKGIALDKYVNGKIFRGVLTGLNEAFVIDAQTRDRLISEDARSEKLIKPFLAGRDIKQYESPEPENFLILIPKGWTRQQIKEDIFTNDFLTSSQTGRIDQKDFVLSSLNYAFDWLSSNYPAIAKYLKPFAEAAEKRCDKGEFWWELRSCDYYPEFEKPKLVYPNICKQPEFTFEENSFYTNQKCFIISTEDKYLLAILNSSISFFLFRQLLPKLRGDFYEPSFVYFKTFPIRELDFTNAVDKSNHDKIVILVDKILKSKKQIVHSQTDKDKMFFDRFCKSLTAKIDDILFDLYDLSEADRKVLENTTQ